MDFHLHLTSAVLFIFSCVGNYWMYLHKWAAENTLYQADYKSTNETTFPRYWHHLLHTGGVRRMGGGGISGFKGHQNGVLREYAKITILVEKACSSLKLTKNGQMVKYKKVAQKGALCLVSYSGCHLMCLLH